MVCRENHIGTLVGDPSDGLIGVARRLAPLVERVDAVDCRRR